MTILDPIEQEIIEDFSLFDEWMEKYEFLIDLGKDLNPMDAGLKTEQNSVKGCQSKVWLHSTLEAGKVIYFADSDAVITKGIVSLLIRALSGRSPKEILHHKLGFIEAIGLKEHLSPNRANGLVSMIKKMKAYALLHEK